MDKMTNKEYDLYVNIFNGHFKVNQNAKSDKKVNARKRKDMAYLCDENNVPIFFEFFTEFENIKSLYRILTSTIKQNKLPLEELADMMASEVKGVMHYKLRGFIDCLKEENNGKRS